MPATTEELIVARSWIGTTESDATFNERFDRLGSLDAAIEESLRAQLAAMSLDQPGAAGLEGMNYSWASNMQYVASLLKDFIAQGGTEEDDTDIGGPNVTQLWRESYR